MVIYSKTGSIILDIEVDDTSYRYRAIRQGDKVYLYFSLTEHIEIPAYSYINFQGQRYILWKPENLTKNGERNLDYTVVFGGWWELLNRTKYKFLSGKPHKLKFPLTVTPRVFMQLLVDNLNLHDSGWTLGTCIDAPEKAMTFSHESCMEVINRLADEYNTEFEFVNKTINFGKVERFKDDPLPLSYGKGNGFKTGVGRQTQGEKAPVTILYVQGGERNIDSSKYGSSTLLLPKNQELEYQGRRYKTDPDGMYISRADRELVNYNEDGYDASDIYPSRIGEVTGLETEQGKDSEGNPVTLYNIVDTTIPESLNYRDCRIPAEKATIIFQSGVLTGKEFDIVQTEKDLTGYDHNTHTFKLSPLHTDGGTFPNENLKPSIGDKYAVFNISLPDAYICDNANKSGASWEMFREAVRYMYENEEECFTFSGELDGIWAKKKWLEIGGKLQPGGYVRFCDNQFQPEGLLIRITAVKDYINKPHSPELELSNTPVAGFVSSELGKIEGNEVKDEERHKEALSFTKRRWRDAKETLEMLSNALLNFSGSINPISVHTMMLLLGDESLQYRFVDNKANPSQTGHIITYDKANKILHIPAGIIQHMTLGIKEISSAHKVSDYKFWTLPALNYAVDGTDAYYLYAKVSKTSETGMFVMSKTAIGMQDVAGYYHLLVGVLNSEFDNERSFVELYGFTEILPGRITTDRIISSDGQNFLDFVNNAVRIGNARTYIDYNSRGDEKIRVKGTIVQSESGEESFIGCFRGTYNSTYTYYEGDEVTYTYNGGTSTYRYIYSSSGKGYVPTNTSRWKLIASQGTNGTNGTNGNDGIDGAYFEYRYAVNGSRTNPPSLSKTSTYPSGWVTEMPAVGSLQYLWCTVAKKNAAGTLLTYWSTPTRITGYDGKDGDPGPALAFRGDYSSGRTYYGTSKRVDAVKYNGIYYVARVDAGSGFYGKVPTNTAYWNEFGNQFENVATNLLLAENAAIGSWWHTGGKIVSTLDDGNKIILDASAAQIIVESTRSAGANSLNTSLGSKITLDAKNGVIEARAKSDTSKVSCVSPSGIFCNSADTLAAPSTSGLNVRAAIVGLGYGNVSRDDVWKTGNFLAALYGYASNSGNAPAYGGYFRDLMAAGLILNRKVIESGGVYLNSSDTFVVGYSLNECSVYLPNDGLIGRIVLLKQRNTGSMKCYARGGQKIYDDNTVNSYFRVPCGSLVIAIFDRCYINNVLTEAWLINSINTLIND